MLLSPAMPVADHGLSFDPAPVSSTLPADVVMDSHQLLKGQREILIRHGDRLYRLRHTSNDKLILTK